MVDLFRGINKRVELFIDTPVFYRVQFTRLLIFSRKYIQQPNG